MPRKSLDVKPVTDAERHARCRAARTAGIPVVRTRWPTDIDPPRGYGRD
jgi:hypothetical protein